MIIQRYKLKYDINKLNEELNELWPLDRYQLTTYATPTGSYYQPITEGSMPTHIKEVVELSIGKKILNHAMLWDFRASKELIKHKDTYGTFDDPPEEIAVVSLENTFTLNIWDDSNSKILKVKQSVTYKPGDIITFNNIDDLHSGEVLNRDIPRRTLNCYV